MSKSTGGDSLSTNNLMVLVVIVVYSLHETEAHFGDSSENGRQSPSAKFVLVICHFTSEARDALLVELFRPLLSALVPLVQTVQVHLLFGRFVPGVDGTPDNDTFRISPLGPPKAVNISDPGNNLVFMFNMRVLSLKLDSGLGRFLLGGDYPRLVDACSFVHQLSSATDRLIIGGLVISLGSLSDGQLIENVSFLTLVNKEPVIDLHSLQIPSKLSFRCAHESRKRNIGTEDIGDVVLSELLDDRVFRCDEGSHVDFTLERYQSLGLVGAALFKSVVVGVQATSFSNFNSIGVVEVLCSIEILVSELLDFSPLSLNLDRLVSESTFVPGDGVGLLVHVVVSNLDGVLILLILLGLSDGGL